MNKEIRQDLLIIGSGIAGLSAALYYADHAKVCLVSKSKLVESNSNYAQGGIAAAVSKFDSPKEHYDDTMAAGHNHNLESSVKILSEEGPDRIQDLIKWGVDFEKKGDDYDLALEAAHSQARVLHNTHFTGKKIIKALEHKVKNHPNIQLLEHGFTEKLLTSHNSCYGALVLKDNSYIRIIAKNVILATGGCGELFPYTSNPKIASGDGYILAYEAGCKLSDLEFIQFHPTAFVSDNDTTFLISEALRGAGAKLLNKHLKPFIKSHSENSNLLARDIIAEEIYKESIKGNAPIYLSCSDIKASVKELFPTIYEHCNAQGYDLNKDAIPINPAAHYMMGGVISNEHAQTNIEHLYAIGEVACTAVHGANRLASNSLLEGIVFAKRAVNHIINQPSHTNTQPLCNDAFNESNEHNLALNRADIQAINFDSLGIIRHESKLKENLSTLKQLLAPFNQNQLLCNQRLSENKHILLLSILAHESALLRTESLGSHKRSDSKQTSNEDYWVVQSIKQPARISKAFPLRNNCSV